jgi:GntR family transcriptional regulator
VLKAYRELEHEGYVIGRPGVGTFVIRTLVAPSPQIQARLRRELTRWVDQARDAGLDTDTMIGLLRTVAGKAEGEAVA